MAQEVTLGGERIGSGNKQKIELHNYGMTSFNLEQDWKSSMAPGILYPFLKLVGTNHGTFDIDLESFVRTLPTRGPLFGSFKLQADIYCAPFRLYQGLLHNNPVSLGMNMDKVKLPKLKLKCQDGGNNLVRVKGSNEDNWQVNETSLVKYLGISGIGRSTTPESENTISRKFNAIPFLAYYDIFKNYYANKQEEDAYVITPGTPSTNTTSIDTAIVNLAGTELDVQEKANITTFTTNEMAGLPFKITGKNLNRENITIYLTYKSTSEGSESEDNYNIASLLYEDYAKLTTETTETIEGTIYINKWITPANRAYSLELSIESDQETIPTISADIKLQSFKLANIDDMRNFLLSNNTINTEVVIGDFSSSDTAQWGVDRGTDGTGLPYTALAKVTDSTYVPYNAFKMNGLVVKTYQSDLFNNWLNTEFIDGENGISAISSVAVVNNKFSMDALNLAEKIYEYLNRVLVSGGTYEDWQEATYGEGAVRKAETPMYVGGMSAEVMFEEVISNSETKVDGDFQPLGSLGGKGTQVGKKGGSNIHIKCEEPCYIIGIVSLTPRVSYSQGNEWDMTELDTIDDLHKPALDGIGFQDLIVEQMAWWNTLVPANGSGIAHRDSAGKQTAWINYQTAVDKCYGDFANQEGYAFMVLNRNYEHGSNSYGTAVKDITTYIDPAKYNYAFAYDKLDAQNFWVQIHSKVIARRKMGAQQIPNL